MIGVLLTPLELLYAAGLRASNARYDRTEPARLKWPVVSVGNLSVGGAGKTPLVIRLAHLLAERGFAPDVLSRGYGRASTAAERVNPAGGVESFGDEPLLIVRAAHVPVFVGASRYAAGMLSELGESDAARHVHLLDDGFQHRQLARAVDIVVVHPDDVRDRLLPVGRLREPLSSLERISSRCAWKMRVSSRRCGVIRAKSASSGVSRASSLSRRTPGGRPPFAELGGQRNSSALSKARESR